MTADPVLLTQRLLTCPSVTPDEAGTLAMVAEFLVARGFSVERLDSGNVGNLYARYGTSSPHLCFAGHTDVVPTGDLAGWISPPFAGEIRERKLYGRGAVDMKGAIGAWLAAVDGYFQENQLPRGSLSILLTSDEEGPAMDGLRYVVEQFKVRGERIDACLIGEPTNEKTVGDTVKTGRRGSLNATLTVEGKSGHVAYPHLAKNPIPFLLGYLRTLLACPLDEGMAHFDPSHLEVVSIDVGNPTTNVIPAKATAKFNIRFNPLHTLDSLTSWLHGQASQTGLSGNGMTYTLETQGSPAFLCEDKVLQALACDAVLARTGITPVLSTGGGTSDGRFLKDICPVIEFGLVNATAHQINEHIPVEEIHRLKAVYQEIITRFFG